MELRSLLFAFLTIVPRTMGQPSPSIPSSRIISQVRTICTSAGERNQESNQILFAALDRFYDRFEEQFRKLVQRTTDTRFLYTGPASASVLLSFDAEKIIPSSEQQQRCQTYIDAVGEISPVSADTFRSTVYVSVRRYASPEEQRVLSQAQHGGLDLWTYKVSSATFTVHTLPFVADAQALQAASSLAAAVKRPRNGGGNRNDGETQ